MKHFLWLIVILAGAVIAQYDVNLENNDAVSDDDPIVRIPLTRMYVENEDISAPTPIPMAELTTLPTNALSRAKRGLGHLNNKIPKIFGGMRELLLRVVGMRKQDGRTDLRNINGLVFVADIFIGTPPQRFSMIFDTGSADTWVPSSHGISETCQENQKFSSTKSSSFRPMSKSRNVTIHYASVKVRMVQGRDNMTVAGIQIKRQVFGQALKMVGLFLESECVGIFGLGFQKIATDGAAPPIVNMIKRNLLNQPVFSIRLNRWVDKVGGELFIGGVDNNSYVSPLQYIPILDGGHWRIHLDKITDPSNKIKICQTGCTAILDTGVSMIVAPSNMFDELNEDVLGAHRYKEANFYVVDCGHVQNLPDITITIQAQPYVLTPNDYIVKLNDAGHIICRSAFDSSGIEDNDFFIFGHPFLQVYYTVFDMGGRQVGLAKSKTPTPAQSKGDSI